jgi:NAD+ diphosphatase
MLFYPRLSPAAIVLVKRGHRILMARSPGFPPGMYSVLAGFVEPGESIEETIEREIREEVGVEVENIRYFGSQPWPFPNSLMIGFIADYAGGELRIEPSEIEDAGWFRTDDLPTLPPKVSIARAMIDDFVAQHGGD